ncbi:IS3 family transposase [Nitrosomonas sp. GH22]|uniref:IS3 family transposase n=1 Tax=Nitrosomonas sp. GH22 TaxID=153947 RepID=UPI00136F5F3B|nr:IS3 family transposase [Nitrosomonas sp. GH22]MXS81395.1 IS3 family transposase [Nitrosomonas sp. GH22]
MTAIKETRRKYSSEFKQETVALVTQQGYTVSQAAEVVNINPTQVRRWKREQEQVANGTRLDEGERLLCERDEVKYTFIRFQQPHYPVTALCRVMRVSTSAYYDCCKRPVRLIDSKTWQLCQRMKTLFIQSRVSLGNRQMVGRYKVSKLMKKLGLTVRNRQRYVVTTSKHNQPVADNKLNRDFSPKQPNLVWTTGITYIRTAQGWIYLAVVLDLYSRRIVGWHMEYYMTTALVNRALMMAINLRQPPKNLLHHSDRGSQYASHDYQTLLTQHNMQCSMSRKGNCWDTQFNMVWNARLDLTRVGIGEVVPLR